MCTGRFVCTNHSSGGKPGGEREQSQFEQQTAFVPITDNYNRFLSETDRTQSTKRTKLNEHNKLHERDRHSI
eukprot:scaffold288979_cov17-Tisochrysis_lutea.AAC.2